DSHAAPSKPPSSGLPRSSHGLLPIEPRRHAAHSGKRQKSRTTRRHAQGRPHAVPPFNRYYQHWNLDPPKDRGGSSASKALAAPKALLTATRSPRNGGDVAAVVV